MTSKREPQIALITGAASGIGREMARVCAQKQCKLVCIDINEKGLHDLAIELKNTYTVDVYTFAIDLALRNAPEKCLEFCDQNHLEVDLLINNAGIFFFDPLLEANPQKVAIMTDLHVYALTRMCMLFGDRMKSRQFGFILNMASMSAWMAMPGISTYNATKSYIRSLSRSLYFELKPWNVGVTAVCPGGINTSLLPISDEIRSLGLKLGALMPPDVLAKKAINATLKKKIQTIPGALNHVFTLFIMVLPNFMISFLMKKLKIYDRFWKTPEATDQDKK